MFERLGRGLLMQGILVRKVRKGVVNAGHSCSKGEEGGC